MRLRPSYALNGWLRALDANANRIREGLRVIEDIVRFTKNDEQATQAIRNLRHRVTTQLQSMGGGTKGWLTRRNSHTDVGKSFHTSSIPRSSTEDLLAANFKRIQESLRVFEELSSLHAPTHVTSFHRLRFDTYRLESSVMGDFIKSFDLSLYVVLDAASLDTRSPYRVAEEALKGGATMVQWRDTMHHAKESLKIAKQLHAICLRYHVPLVINDRVEVAALAGAEGVHLGQQDLSIADARARLGDYMIIGRSNNTLREALQSAREGADYISVGPVFETATKVPHRPLIRIPLLTQIQKKVRVPVVAIGGITPERVEHIMNTGVAGVAISSAICLKQDIQEETRRFLRIIKRSKKQKKS